MLDALLATIGTLGVLASIAFKLRAPRDDAGSSDTDAEEDPARSDMPRGCPRRRLRRRRR